MSRILVLHARPHDVDDKAARLAELRRSPVV